ncbi:flagellar basal-body rod protein FlgB [Crenobacter luteus]|uniref:Flagellar basal body rod protein FlgB n=1 Tax=Crenobacter luteus TaxID=1452487 RepID=A0A161S9I6_9NEIS|nr:flagellar basal body rod protein FlgB [Crenobacter luteus]KZE31753.1 flagellar biosynthesis protein FlgB [Crenobacter luteus]TCP15617.1 flagellar basal-body rod protein FlgB [Crenobacter luteus]
MGIHFDKALGIHPEALKLRAERTKVLASNIANESTPGYQARDLDFKATLAGFASDGDGFPAGLSAGEALYRVPYHPSRDGNTVELGVEQAEFAQNASEFQTSLTFLNMKYQGLAKVIAGQ